MLFQPIRKNDDDRFVPVVLMHDHDANGTQMMDRLRSIAWQRLSFNALLVCPTFTGAYGFLQSDAGYGYGPGADQMLIDALAAQTQVKELTERMLVFGFGDGAQFAHRFVMQHPRRVAGCVALSGNSWTDPHGFCGGPMIQAGGFDEAPFDTEEVHAARKAACTEPTALPGVRWLVGASTHAPAQHAAAEQFRNDLARAASPAEILTWDGEDSRVPMPQIMASLAFFNDVVAEPAELPPAPAKPVQPVSEAAEAETTENAESPEISETTETSDTADTSDATDAPNTPAPDAPMRTDMLVDPPSVDLGPDDSDAPLSHGRVESADSSGASGTLTARERAQLAPKPKAPAPKPGEGNGFFDQLLRQQAPPNSDAPA